jgi:hypothetical protein
MTDVITVVATPVGELPTVITSDSFTKDDLTQIKAMRVWDLESLEHARSNPKLLRYVEFVMAERFADANIIAQIERFNKEGLFFVESLGADLTELDLLHERYALLKTRGKKDAEFFANSRVAARWDEFNLIFKALGWVQDYTSLQARISAFTATN